MRLRAPGVLIFVAVDEDSQDCVVAKPDRLQDGEGVQDDGHASLLVGDTGSERAVALDPEGSAREGPARVDRVHVRKEQDLARPASLEASDDDLADLRRGVEQLHRVRARLDHLHLAAERGEALL